MEKFFEKYKEYIFDSRGRINSNIRKTKVFKNLENDLFNLTKNYPNNITLSARITALKLGKKDYPICECCNNPVKYTAGKFTNFCSFKCSRTKGSSTFKKIQETCLKKYGAKSNLATKENLDLIYKNNGGIGKGSKLIKAKIEKTNKEKYGSINPWSNKSIQDKIKETHNKKYGGNFHTIKLGKKIELLNDKDWCKKIAKEHCLSTISEMIGVASNTVYKYFEKHNIKNFNSTRSKQEEEIFNFIKSLDKNVEIVRGNREIIKPFELDFYFPEKKLAIEFNGLYWHSDLSGMKRNYHLNKLKLCESKNIQLIQIFENEWNLKQEIVKSKIKSLFGKTDRIYARKCKLIELTTKEKDIFLEENHLQGKCNSAINLGLLYNGNLIACMTFSKSRFDKQFDFELIRYCSKININVVGGFSKLLKFFQSLNYGKTLVTFADRRWSQGQVYEKNDFKKIIETKPAYFYFKNSSIILENRQQYQKHKLQSKLSKFDKTMSEWENMKNNGYNRIWDCGTIKYKYQL